MSVKFRSWQPRLVSHELRSRNHITAVWYLFVQGGTALVDNAGQLVSQDPSANIVKVSASVSPQLRVVASVIADYFSRIAHAHLDVRVGDGTSGFTVGSVADFPRLFARGMALYQ